MKKITLANTGRDSLALAISLRKRQHSELGGAVSTPTPFPGKYPTKIVVILIHNDKMHFNYIGKPIQMVWGVVDRFMKAWVDDAHNLGSWKHVNRFALVIEFDRKNTIVVGNFQAKDVVRNYCYPSWWDSKLLQFYYPWNALEPMVHFRDGAEIKYFFKTLRIGKKFWKIYSLYERLRAVDHVLKHKDWVEKTMAGKLVLE